MTAFRIEIEGPCVVTLTCDEQGNVRQEIQVRGRALHVAEFSAAPQALASPPAEAAAPPEDWAGEEDSGAGYSAALAGPGLLEPLRPRAAPRRPPPAPRPREI